EIAAIPRFRIGHEASDNARFAPGAILAPLVDTNLNIFLLEALRSWARGHTKIIAGARPARVVLEEFGIIIARGDQLRLTALDVLRDFIEKLLILPALEGFDQRVDAG